MFPDIALLQCALRCACPQCRQGSLYKPGLTLSLRNRCPVCGLDFAKNDSADAPAVFLIFILGAALVPLALALEWWISPPLWVHAVIWGGLALLVTVGTLRPLKAYIIGLQFKHRRTDWE
ncbi:MAG: DUF983 domain-containing protein [Alphaproteobacteria bacterium]|nr:DUF983 domain-containing protein [Alphaproteobacteria bacterium]